MSCKLHKINGKHNSFAVREYIIDNLDEIELLPKYGINGKMNVDKSDTQSNKPCDIGSTALVCQGSEGTPEVWMLSPSNEWVKL